MAALTSTQTRPISFPNISTYGYHRDDKKVLRLGKTLAQVTRAYSNALYGMKA